MPLSARDLQTPHATPRRDSDFVAPLMTRIEASFYRGLVDEMQQWMDSGTLEKLMQGQSRAQTAYHNLLPQRLLEAARHLDRLHKSPLTQKQLEQWWSQLMVLRTVKHFSPITSWMLPAASLPISLADEWVKQGASPHAGVVVRNQKQTPFLMLLSDTFKIQDNPRRKATGWAGQKEVLAVCHGRLESWVKLPGMDLNDADNALGMLAVRALVSDPGRPDDFYRMLRDQLVARGAGSTSVTMGRSIATAIAPSMSNTPKSKGARAQFDLARSERETYRTGATHRARILEWGEVLTGNPSPRDDHPWALDCDLVSSMLRIPQGSRLATNALKHAPGFWEGITSSRARQSFIIPFKIVESQLERLTRLKELSALRAHDNAPSSTWCVASSKEYLWHRHGQLTVDEMAALLELCNESKDQLSLVDVWLHRQSSSTEDEVPNIRAILAFLQERKLLVGLLPSAAVEEGSHQDLTDVRNSFLSWLKEDRLTQCLRDLDEPFASRIRKLQMWFIDPALPIEKMAQRFAEAVALVPQWLPAAVDDLILQFDKRSTDIRLPSKMQELRAFASLGCAVAEDKVTHLWKVFGEILSPRFDRETHPTSFVKEVAQLLNQIAPISQAQGEPVRSMLALEFSASVQGHMGTNETLALRWSDFDDVLQELIDLGARLDQVPVPTETKGFAAKVKVIQAVNQLQEGTAVSTLGKSPRRM